MLEYLKNCWKNDSEHAKIFWKHALECSKIVFEKVEKSWKKSWKMFLESSIIYYSEKLNWKKNTSQVK